MFDVLQPVLSQTWELISFWRPWTQSNCETCDNNLELADWIWYYMMYGDIQNIGGDI